MHAGMLVSARDPCGMPKFPEIGACRGLKTGAPSGRRPSDGAGKSEKTVFPRYIRGKYGSYIFSPSY
jgi:hypothetical protein